MLDHCGGPIGVGSYTNRRDEVFKDWKASIQDIAKCPNVVVKLGGLAMRLLGYDFHERPLPPSSEDLDAAWRPYIETCIEASALIRRVSRPDVLMVAALLHDIGKGQLTEHCVAGEPIARTIARRMGFDERETELVAAMVRWHLLLPETATTRDAEDPATVELVTGRIHDREELELLFALTEADAKATSEKAWTSWRASLVRSLVRRTAAELSDTDPADRPVAESDRTIEIPGQAVFVSAGGYHHHMAMNVWNSRGAGRRQRTLGLGQVDIVVPCADDVGELTERMRHYGVEARDDGQTVAFDDPWSNLIRVRAAG